MKLFTDTLINLQSSYTHLYKLLPTNISPETYYTYTYYILFVRLHSFSTWKLRVCERLLNVRYISEIHKRTGIIKYTHICIVGNVLPNDYGHAGTGFG